MLQRFDFNEALGFLVLRATTGIFRADAGQISELAALREEAKLSPVQHLAGEHCEIDVRYTLCALLRLSFQGCLQLVDDRLVVQQGELPANVCLYDVLGTGHLALVDVHVAPASNLGGTVEEHDFGDHVVALVVLCQGSIGEAVAIQGRLYRMENADVYVLSPNAGFGLAGSRPRPDYFWLRASRRSMAAGTLGFLAT